MTSTMPAVPQYTNMSPYHHSIMRLPSINQLSPNSNVTQFYNQKISKTNASESKAQNNSISNGGSNVKRKRSWSRAVFSNLQRKGLERQFEFQKYITKPDRKKLAARLGLKDAQVKVWFQVSCETIKFHFETGFENISINRIDEWNGDTQHAARRFPTKSSQRAKTLTLMRTRNTSRRAVATAKMAILMWSLIVECKKEEWIELWIKKLL